MKLTDNARTILERRYLAKKSDGSLESPEDMLRRVAQNIAEVEYDYAAHSDEVEEIADKFFHMMDDKDFLPNSPTLRNAGRELQQLSACYVLPVEDDLGSIFETLKRAAMIHKSGGGTGYSFSRLRPKGDKVSTTGNVAGGPVSFMRVFNEASQQVTQGGCLSTKTWVLTSRGMIRLGELINAPPKKDTPLHELVLGRSGYQPAFLAMDNGVDNTYHIITELGVSIDATGNHLIRVVNDEGRIAWKPACEILVGDWLPIHRGGYTGYDRTLPVQSNGHGNSVNINIPDRVNPELAELVGYFMANGCLSTGGRLVISVPHDTTDEKEWIVDSLEKFGVHVTVEQKPDDASYNVVVHSVNLHDWWISCGFDKDGSLHANIPERICTSSVESARAFIRGLFDGDGTVHSDGTPMLCTGSKTMAYQLQQLMLGLGMVSRVGCTQTRSDRFGDCPMYTLSIRHRPSLDEFRTNVGFRSSLKQDRMTSRLGPGVGRNSDPIPYAGAMLSRYYDLPGRGSGPKRSARAKHPKTNKRIARYIRGDRIAHRRSIHDIVESVEELSVVFGDELMSDDLVYSRVVEVDIGKEYTMDIEMGGEPEFVANGLLVHNIRMGANMAVLRVDHPDIMEFIHCKDDPSTLPAFNISVGVTDEFMGAVHNDGEYGLINPRKGYDEGKQLNARKVLREIAECAWSTGDPGILFLDEVNRYNPTPHLGEIESSNPCGEQPLLPYESCCLGSINLSNMVTVDEEDGYYFPDWDKIRSTVRLAVRFLDNVIDANLYTHPDIETATKSNRKIGLGVMGWADMLVKLGIPYGSASALDTACSVMSCINMAAHEESEMLAGDRGPYPECIDRPDRRNATVTTIAPTGTISLIAGCSSGIEPYFALVYERGVIYDEEGPTEMIRVVEPVFEQYLRDSDMYSDEFLHEVVQHGGSIQDMDVPYDMKHLFATANDISYTDHVNMQAAFQKYVENAISKTVNLSNDATVDDVYDTIMLAWESGCKGLTVYRDGCREDQVINWSARGEEEHPPVQLIEGARSRPESTLGHTERVVVGCGRKLFITVNEDDEGLFEVFMNVGKGGGCIASHTEALGRMVSLALRNYVEPSEIIEQLAGIRCPYIQWNHDGVPYTSCADAVAKVVAKYADQDAQEIVKELRMQSNSPECPECGAPLAYQEGCVHCTTCGYTMC